MKKKYFFTVLILGILLFTIQSCGKKEKNKNELITQFVEKINSNKTKIKDGTIRLENTKQTGETEITLNFKSELSSDAVQSQMIKTAISDMMIQVIRQDKNNILLLNKGVNFKIILTGKNGENLATEIVNKSNMTSKKPDFSVNEKHKRLNQVLEVSNGNLPVTDPSSGVTITKVFVGNNNDVIYYAEIPDQLKSIIKTEQNKKIIRQNMLADKEFMKMVKELKSFDIKTVKYQYRDKQGNLVQEVEIK